MAVAGTEEGWKGGPDEDTVPLDVPPLPKIVYCGGVFCVLEEIPRIQYLSGCNVTIVLASRVSRAGDYM
jgi:hypothetical protein